MDSPIQRGRHHGTSTGRRAAVLALVFAAAVASALAAPGLQGLLGGGLAVLMIAIAIIDARLFIIPDRLTLAAFALGLLYALLDPQPPLYAILIALARGTVVGLAFLAVRVIYLRIRGRDGIGLGDVKLAAVGGVWLDWPPMAFAVEVAALAALAAVAVRALRGHRISGATPLPFGLFLAPAIWIGWVFEWTVLPWL
jgi:leader peptidase (prepilin peptidase)/N-methyltransferase